jgi:hypothetical protein
MEVVMDSPLKTTVAQYYGDVLLALGMSANLNPRFNERGEAGVSAEDFASQLRAEIEGPLRARIAERDASLRQAVRNRR